MQTIPKERIDYIDGLRAIAVLAVVATHTSTLNPSFMPYAISHFSVLHGPAYALFSFFGAGNHGIDLFFIISGFCLAYPTLFKLRANGSTKFDVKNFFEKRIVRIFPPYAVAVVLTGALYLYLQHAGILHPWTMAAHVGIKDFLKQFFLLDQQAAWLNNVFWTLPIEARWYVIFPVALAAWIRAPRIFLAALVIIEIWFRYTNASTIDLGVLPAFMVGIIAADLRVRKIALRRYTLPVGLVFFAIALFIETKVRVAITWQITAFCFVTLAGESHRLQRILSIKPLTAVGAASYSIYLIHDHVCEFVTRAILPLYGPYAAWGLAAACGVLAGFVFWALVERPFSETALRERCLNLVRIPSARFFALFESHELVFAMEKPAVLTSTQAQRGEFSVVKDAVPRHELV